MEKALYIQDTKNIKPDDLKGIERIYYGVEFCENLVPEWNTLLPVIDFCRQHQLGFSFMTPYVTNSGLEKLEKIFVNLNRENGIAGQKIEVIVNDYGTLMALEKYNGVERVIGRVLSKQERGSRVISQQGGLENKNPDQRMSAFSTPLVEFLKKKKVRRVEIDNLLQGIKDDFSVQGIEASIYFPYAFVTTTRRCLFNMDDKQLLTCIKPCSKDCLKFGHLKLSSKKLPVPLLLKGNTQYIISKKLPSDLVKKGITRLVYEIELPR
jgi:hypothetical protein